MRSPLVTNGGRGSFGTAFLLTVMWARPSAASASLPVTSLPDEVEQEQVIVRAARDDLVAALHQHRHHRARVGQYLLLVPANSGCSASRNATALAAITCISGPPCVPGNISELSFLVIPRRRARGSARRAGRAESCAWCVVTTCACGTGFGYKPAATSPATCAMSTRRYAPTESAMRAEARPVDDARIRRETGDDHLRSMLARKALHLRVVDLAGCRIEAVLDGVEELAREIDLGAVRQVPAVVEAHAEDGVARLDQRQVRGRIRLRAGMRLHVGVVRAEQLLRAVDRELLGDVDVLAAAVVALARDSPPRTCW